LPLVDFVESLVAIDVFAALSQAALLEFGRWGQGERLEVDGVLYFLESKGVNALVSCLLFGMVDIFLH
jgi:hypothetical protein